MAGAGGQGGGHGAAQVADVEAGEQVRQRPPLGCLDAFLQVADGDLAPAADPTQPVPLDAVEVARVGPDDPELDQLLHPLLAQALDVHGTPAGEVLDPSRHPGRAVLVRAPVIGLALRAQQRGAAHRAILGEGPGRSPLGPQGQDRADDLGYDVAGLAHDDRVALAHVLGPHLVLVVERGGAHGGAADEHRLEHGEGGGPAGAADRHHDLTQPRGALLGRVFKGDGPPGGVRRRADLPALGQVVDLHDDPVDLVVEVVAVLEPVLGEGEHLVERGDRRHVRVDREAEAGDPPQGLAVAGEVRTAVHEPELVGPEAEAAGGGDGGVLLAQRARPGVAGVDERAQPSIELGPLQPLEDRQRHVDLTAHLEHRRRPFQPHRHRLDRGDVVRDILAHLPVAPGGGLHQPAALVAEAHGQPVDLQLAAEGDVAVDEALSALAPRLELGGREGVV